MDDDHARRPTPDAQRIVIAIDGPAASGKSSTAHWVAEQLGYHHVDSGALYRAATAAQLRRGIPAEAWTEQDVLECASRVRLVAVPGAFAPTVAGEPIDEEIRGPEVTRHVSLVAQMPGVRSWVNEMVRDAARAHD